jgi:hypothetical protein
LLVDCRAIVIFTAVYFHRCLSSPFFTSTHPKNQSSIVHNQIELKTNKFQFQINHEERSTFTQQLINNPPWCRWLFSVVDTIPPKKIKDRQKFTGTFFNSFFFFLAHTRSRCDNSLSLISICNLGQLSQWLKKNIYAKHLYYQPSVAFCT